MSASSVQSWLDAWDQAAGLPPGARSLRLLATAGRGEPAALEECSVGEIDRALLALREALFGREFVALGKCPRCAATIECPLDARALQVAGPAATGAPRRSVTLQFAERTIELRLPRPLDLDAVRTAGPLAASRLFARCVVHDDHGATPGIPEPSTELVAMASAALEELDPQAALSFALECPDCAAAWTQPWDPGEFLWQELDAWARATLRDVDCLARHYGWSESEILALSPRRRAHYLELVQA